MPTSSQGAPQMRLSRFSRSIRRLCIAACIVFICAGASCDKGNDSESSYNLDGDYCVRILEILAPHSVCVLDSLSVVIASKPEIFPVRADVYMSLDSGITWDILNSQEPFSLLNAVCTVSVFVPDSFYRSRWDPDQAVSVNYSIPVVSGSARIKIQDYDDAQCAEVSATDFSVSACN